MATTTKTVNRSSGGCRGYTNEQKTLRFKLDHLLKWTRDLKSSLMKQSCKVLQTSADINSETINQIHDELDEYKRKFDRELGRIHDICDALANNTRRSDADNLRDEVLEALRRSPTYSSLEQHIHDDERPRIRVKPRERLHPRQNHVARSTNVSTDLLKRKASQPIALEVLDRSSMSGNKRRSQIDSFKRSRSFINVEHTETRLGMDYVDEDKSDISWKPFGPKRTTSQVSVTSNNTEQSNDEATSENSNQQSQPVSTIPNEKPKSSSVRPPPPPSNNDDSSDEEFDVAWQRRQKKQSQKENALTTVTVTPASNKNVAQPTPKRTVRFSPSTDSPVQFYLDETTQDVSQLGIDQNNNDKQQSQSKSSIENDNDDTDDGIIISIDDNDIKIANSTSLSVSQQKHSQDDDAEIVIDSDEEEIIELSDDEKSSKSKISRKSTLTTSEIQITTGSSQYQSLHNPYRVGIADPSLRSVFLPPPSSQNSLSVTNTNRKAATTNRKASPTKRATNKN